MSEARRNPSTVGGESTHASIARFQLPNTRPIVRVRTVSHYITFWLGTRFPRIFPFLFVIGYPKSGTTWVSQLAADYLQLPFPRYSILPVGCPAVVHGHETVSTRFPCGLYVMRDGRDALTSLYFFLARRIPAGRNPAMTRRQRKMFPRLVDRDDVTTNFTPFLEQQLRDPHSSRQHWGDHVRSFFEKRNRNMALIRYEDLRLEGEAAFSQAMQTLFGAEPDGERLHATFEKFSFARQAGRKAGQEDRLSFLRKGEVGDWRNHFTREAADIFNDACGEALVLGGYEQDRSWVETFQREPAAQAV